MPNVPDTNTFSLQDVDSVVPSFNNDLTSYFSNAVDSFFDPIYVGNKDRLSNFRNYGGAKWLGYMDDGDRLININTIASFTYVFTVEYSTSLPNDYSGTAADHDIYDANFNFLFNIGSIQVQSYYTADSPVSFTITTDSMASELDAIGYTGSYFGRFYLAVRNLPSDFAVLNPNQAFTDEIKYVNGKRTIFFEVNFISA